MRARKKKNTVPRLERVSDYFVPVIPQPSGEIRVEVGCGKGKFITALAKDHPDVTFYALEKIPDVIVMAAEKASREEIGNVKFLLADAKDLTEGTEKTFMGLDENRQPILQDVAHTALCPTGSVSVLYLNFSDPLPNKKHADRRLTHANFLEKYRTILKADGHIEFKTDNKPLFDFSVEQFRECGYEIYDYTEDLHRSDIPNPYHTEYETRFSEMGMPIYSLKAKP
ncbi:MAG: methyltransferase domain-containing protein [Clostridia bacterium]|nr:methyltransferase domain-containing protein [Clostridia bacterium]